MKRSFFRRKPSAPAAPDTNGKGAKRNFGRVATMQPMNPVGDDDLDDEEHAQLRRTASEDALSARRHVELPLAPDVLDAPAPPPAYAPPALQPPATAVAAADDDVDDVEPQPKLERGRSSKSQRHMKRRGSGKRAKERERTGGGGGEREREREREKRGHHHQREKDEALLVQLNKLLDTLTSRELQLSLRVDKADEAVRNALAKRGNAAADDETSRKRALCALKHKRLLERSLAVTTAQSDRVLRMLGQNVLPTLAERIEAAAARARHGFEHDEVHPADALPFHCDDDEQILREIDATLNPAVAVSAAVAPASPAPAPVPAHVVERVEKAESADWLAEVREQYARRATAGENENESQQAPVRVREVPPDNDRVQRGFETVPEAVAPPLDKPRLSRDKRSSVIDAEPPKTSRMPRGPTFSRRRRKDKERM